MIDAPAQQIRLFCVDDNVMVIDAVRLQLERAPDVQWAGSAASADEMLDRIDEAPPDVILLDIDMPGKSPFEAIGELMLRHGDVRVLMYSGLIDPQLVNDAIEAGAWGYVAKVDGEREMLDAVREVAAGAFAFSPAVRAVMR